MTQKASPEWFTCPGLTDGDRVAVQLDDGTLAEGYWYDDAVHDEPRAGRSANPHFGRGDSTEPWRIEFARAFWPNRPPAPWRIRKRDGEWRIEKRQTHGYETWCRFDTSTEAFAAFAAGCVR
ncbi:hypothetical protein [Mycobacteroides immunogenum]|uniref:Uncharacterized protein n=1 Tax=Mycobacteroides immunogenum TaxID=83262 RepID=A0A7V8RXG7_9MYCO|nr:hypothetical protein [Mycobacteroides immunogenum]AMT72061.1 hypothetical protein ABG82_18965 [Mycobacteroides immunogenum]ANO05190.1 hypothetical protein BAB75_19235 [Mycobacteroides immunogenum]KIU40139.1 hypothetical protein TL11_12715 [Mycobacteroides immunogenum]KPG13637.1 hypothetical protein AN909_04990 [Mycobacteroides immunogenum]KPG14442.1 hypothetical protein AN908_07875 [Mycobacteroides immunogenum]